MNAEGCAHLEIQIRNEEITPTIVEALVVTQLISSMNYLDPTMVGDKTVVVEIPDSAPSRSQTSSPDTVSTTAAPNNNNNNHGCQNNPIDLFDSDFDDLGS